MNSVKVAVTLIVVAVIGVFFLLPVISYSAVGNPNFKFEGAKANANVSPSYATTGCGIVYNPNINTTLGDVHGQSPVWNGARWTCGTSWTQSNPS